MKFLENTELLKIEDILPFFPDFVVIDDFKDEICHALEGYAEHIDRLRGVMDDATAGADAIKQDIDALSRRVVSVDAGERCAKCAYALLTRQFYVFPCQHSFHADCLIALVRLLFFGPVLVTDILHRTRNTCPRLLCARLLACRPSLSRLRRLLYQQLRQEMAVTLQALLVRRACNSRNNGHFSPLRSCP